MKEIKVVKFYSIMVDEVISYNKEEFVLCVCFVDDSNEVREEFFVFFYFLRIIGKVIVDKIIIIFYDMGLEIVNIRG